MEAVVTLFNFHFCIHNWIPDRDHCNIDWLALAMNWNNSIVYGIDFDTILLIMMASHFSVVFFLVYNGKICWEVTRSSSFRFTDSQNVNVQCWHFCSDYIKFALVQGSDILYTNSIQIFATKLSCRLWAHQKLESSHIINTMLFILAYCSSPVAYWILSDLGKWKVSCTSCNIIVMLSWFWMSTSMAK